jgi:hypothetical protein
MKILCMGNSIYEYIWCFTGVYELDGAYDSTHSYSESTGFRLGCIL